MMPMNFLNDLFENACPSNNPVEDDFGNMVFTFWIETHCVGWWVEAYKGNNGDWVVVEAKARGLLICT